MQPMTPQVMAVVTVLEMNLSIFLFIEIFWKTTREQFFGFLFRCLGHPDNRDALCKKKITEFVG